MTFRDVLVRSKAFKSVKEPFRAQIRKLGYEITRSRVERDEFLRGLLGREQIDLVVDAGANQGQYANSMRHLGYEHGIVSFEPSADAYRFLSRAAAGDPRWRTVEVALGSSPGSLDLNISANSVSSSLLAVSDLHVSAERESRTIRRETVPVTTLDDELRAETSSTSAIWLKLDVQGFEREVLAGGKRTMERTRVLQCEASLRPLYEGGADYLDLLRDVRDVGLTPIWFEPAFTDPGTGEMLQFDFIAARR